MASTKTRRPNAYAGACSTCGGRVAASAGYLGPQVDGRWTVEHITCPQVSVVTAGTVDVAELARTVRSVEVYGPRGQMYRRSHRCGPGWCHVCHDED